MLDDEVDDTLWLAIFNTPPTGAGIVTPIDDPVILLLVTRPYVGVDGCCWYVDADDDADDGTR